MADTASLVVALSAQLTKFEKDMRDAGIMAERTTKDIEDKFSKMNPQVSASFLGNLFSSLVTKGLDAAIKAVADFADGFIALKAAADLAEISLAKVYGISSALGKDAGANAAAIEKLATMLDQMRRGQDTTFGELKAANPAFFQNMGKDTFDVAENMARVAEMVKQAGSEVEKLEIARQAGFTRDMVKELEKGGAHFRQMTADNQELGRQLAIASAQAEVMSKAFAEAARNAFGLKDIMGDFWKDTAMIIGGLVSGLEKIKSLSANTWGGGGGGSALEPVIADLKKLTDGWKSAGDAAAKTYDEQQKVTGGGTKTADPGKALAHPALRATGGAAETDNLARQNDQIEKHIGLMNADAAAVGLGAAKREELRTMSLLLTAAEKDHVTVTEELRLAMQVQAEEAGKAAQKLAEANHKVQELNQASQILGSAISTAFTDAILEGKKLDEVLQSLLKTLAKAAINASIMQLFTPGAGAGVSPFLSALGFGGGKMAGGPVSAGSAYLVGERGPELMVPGSSGMVVPNAVLGRGGDSGGGQPIVYNINAAGADAGTVARIESVLFRHARAIAGQARAMTSTQRLQATGVS